MTNFYLGLIGSYAVNTVTETLLLSFQNQLFHFKGMPQSPTLLPFSFTHEDYSQYLPQSHKFLCSQLSTFNNNAGAIPNELLVHFSDCNLTDVKVQDIGSIAQVDVALILRAFCLLLQSPFDLLSQQVTILQSPSSISSH